MSTYLIVLSLAVAAASAQQQQYLPWEQQTDVGSIPAWYAPKASGFASPAGASINLASSSTGGFPSSPFAARPSYPPNFPGYPTFGTVQPGGIPYSFTTTHKPRTTSGFRPKPTGSRSNLDKYLPLMKKKKATSTSTTSTTTPAPSTTRRRKLPTKKTTVASTTRKPKTTVRPTTVRPTKTTTVAESGEWESLEIVEKATTVKATVQTTSASKKAATSKAPQTTSTTTVKQTTTSSEERKEEEKETERLIEKLIKGPMVPRGKPERPAFLLSTTTAQPPAKSTTVRIVEKSSTAKSAEVEEEAEFNLLGFLWDKSELLASIKNMIKQLKSSIDEAGLEEDVKQVSDHFKNTIKTFASASPVNEQLGRLFERAQNSDVKLD